MPGHVGGREGGWGWGKFAAVEIHSLQDLDPPPPLTRVCLSYVHVLGLALLLPRPLSAGGEEGGGGVGSCLAGLHNLGWGRDETDGAD